MVVCLIDAVAAGFVALNSARSACTGHSCHAALSSSRAAPRCRSSVVGPLMMGKKKGQLLKVLADEPSDKQLRKEQKAAVEAQVPMPSGTMPIAQPDAPGREVYVDGARTVSVDGDTNTKTIDREEEDAVLESDFDDEAEDDIEKLRNYAMQNGLAIDMESMAVVQLPKGEQALAAAVFPAATQELRAKHPLSLQPTVEQFVSAVEALVPGDSTDLTLLKEFLLANRHVGGKRALLTFIQLKLQAQSLGDRDRALRMRHLAASVMRAESAISAPFRQAMKDAETRLAPHMGSPDVSLYSGNNAVETTTTWLCLKAVVAEWEKRYREASGIDMPLTALFKIDALGDNRLDLDRTSRVTAAVQQMALQLSADEQLMARLPPEARFLDLALGANTTSEVRRIALQELCPREGISPEELRRRLRSLVCSVDSLERVSYGMLQVSEAQCGKLQSFCVSLKFTHCCVEASNSFLLSASDRAQDFPVAVVCALLSFMLSLALVRSSSH
jgi:hypothetical protein